MNLSSDDGHGLEVLDEGTAHGNENWDTLDYEKLLSMCRAPKGPVARVQGGIWGRGVCWPRLWSNRHRGTLGGCLPTHRGSCNLENLYFNKYTTAQNEALF